MASQPSNTSTAPTQSATTLSSTQRTTATTITSATATTTTTNTSLKLIKLPPRTPPFSTQRTKFDTDDDQNLQNTQASDDLVTPNKRFIDQKKLKKRSITNADLDLELICPICYELINVAHVTKCGHSFCQSCILRAIEHTHRCPKCNTPCNTNKDVFPNFALNQIIDRFKDEQHNKKCKFASNSISKAALIDYINSSNDQFDIDEVDQLLNILVNKKEELKYSNLKITETLLHDFLKHLKQVKHNELKRLEQELQMVNEDCDFVEEKLTVLNKSLATTSSVAGNLNNLLSDNDDHNQVIENGDNSNPYQCKMRSQLITKKHIINRYFDELSESYMKHYNKDFQDIVANSKDSTCKSDVLGKLRETVSKITDYTQFKCIASVNYCTDSYNLSSIVSSIDFDRSYEHFACVGVTKKIKIYDFDTIIEKSLDRTNDVHFPIREMQHNAKLSCISWNNYFKNQLVCSDYDGVVTLWDAEVGTLMKTYQEHEKRCWGVQFCDVDPRIFASASDDSRVKLWSTNSEYSLVSIDAKSNVCCVAFKPDSKFHVLFGTADHCIHYYDLRNAKEAIRVFKGHRKAVSYVKFSSNNEFVSASTDSTLKSWKLNEGQCMRSYSGHYNEKNFVGLESYNGYVVTGSENNTVYLYYKELTKPLIQYKFDDNSNGFNEKGKRDETVGDFVSALCWSNQNILLAANSQGVVKVLELS